MYIVTLHQSSWNK